jgi:hypothetical protein
LSFDVLGFITSAPFSKFHLIFVPLKLFSVRAHALF